jgi:hypothetical protein
MKSEVIYEKKYPPIDYDNIDAHIKIELPETPVVKPCSFDGAIKEIYENTKYTPIPYRDDLSKEFIKKAIDVADIYQMDITVLRLDGKISVWLSIDFCVNMQYINCLFGMADRISFFSGEDGHDIFVCLDLYTHVIVRSGLAYAP